MPAKAAAAGNIANKPDRQRGMTTRADNDRGGAQAGATRPASASAKPAWGRAAEAGAATQRPASATPGRAGAPAERSVAQGQGGGPKDAKAGNPGQIRLLQRAGAQPSSKAQGTGSKQVQASGAGEKGKKGGAAQRPDKHAQKPEKREAPVLFPSDSQSFPSLDQAFVSAPRGSWARGPGTTGSWSSPAHATSNHVTGAQRVHQQQHKLAERHVEEEKWTTVAPKPKAGGRVETAAPQLNAHAPSAWGGWGGKEGWVRLNIRTCQDFNIPHLSTSQDFNSFNIST